MDFTEFSSEIATILVNHVLLFPRAFRGLNCVFLCSEAAGLFCNEVQAYSSRVHYHHEARRLALLPEKAIEVAEDGRELETAGRDGLDFLLCWEISIFRISNTFEI